MGRELGCEYLPFSDWDRRQFSEFALLACSVVIAPLIEIPFAPVSFGDPLKGLEWNGNSTYPHPISLKFRYVSPETHFQIRLSAQLFLERYEQTT